MNLISSIKNRTYYYFDDMIKFVDFYFDNVLIDEKSVLLCTFYQNHPNIQMHQKAITEIKSRDF